MKMNETNQWGKGNSLKPLKRTKFRILIGKSYYTFARKITWTIHNKQYAKKQAITHYPVTIFKHSTPIFRQLKNVDMWMQENKSHNLKIATEKIHGIIIQPGETFSYWKLIGNPSKRSGYKDGMILYYGSFKPGVGGGLCQLSNLLFWMALHSPLTITERYRHSYDVFPDIKRNIPFGSGATCVYNYRDLQFKNETDSPVQILVKVDGADLVGTIVTEKEFEYTYEVYEKEHVINHHSWGGYTRHNTLYRKTYKSGKLESDDFLFENHALMMYQPYLSESKT